MRFLLLVFLSLFLNATEVTLRTETKAYPFLRIAVTKAGFKVVDNSPVVLDVRFDLPRHLYEGVRDEFTVKIQILNEGRCLYSSQRTFDFLRYSPTPLWNRDLAPKVGALYLSHIFSVLDLEELLGNKRLGQVVAVRGHLVVVDSVLPEGLKVSIFSQDPKGEFLIGEGQVFCNGPRSSEILLTEVFSNIKETQAVRIQGR